MNIPRLLQTAFDENGQYNIKTNGIGFLTDCLSCVVTERENGEYTMSLKYPTTGVLSSEIQLGRVMVSKPNPFDEEQAFVISAIKRDSSGSVSVTANHISYQLGGIMVTNFNAMTAKNFSENLNRYAVNCEFVFDTDIERIAFYGGAYRPPKSFRQILLDKNDSFKSTYGGYIRFYGMNVFAFSTAGEDTGAEISFGKNLLSLSQNCALAGGYSTVYPYWYSEDVLPAQNRYVELTEKVIPTGISLPKEYNATLPLDLSSIFEEKPTEDDLRLKAQEWISTAEILVQEEELRIKFADLSKTTEYKGRVPIEKLRMFDIIRVVYPAFGISKKAKITGTKYNVLKDSYDDIYLGNYATDFSDTILNRG